MDRGDAFEQLAPRRLLADSIYDLLLTWLIDGKIEPDAQLNIDALSRDLKVSPTPVREALARLEATGLVTRTALKGYRVAPVFTREEINELMDARLLIEPANAFLATSHLEDRDLETLAATIEELRSAPRGPSFADFRGYWEADERFHRVIAENAANRFLLSAYSSLGGHVQRFRLFSGLGVRDAEHAIAEHSTILAAFTGRDPELARDAMLAHVSGVKHRALSEVEQRSH